MPDKFVSKIVTPFGERLIKAAAVTDDVKNELQEFVVFDYDTATFEEISSAIENEKNVVISEDNGFVARYAQLQSFVPLGSGAKFVHIYDGNLITYAINPNGTKTKTTLPIENGKVEFVSFDTTFAGVGTILTKGKLPILVEETTPSSPNYYSLINNNGGTEYIFGNISGTLNKTYKLSGGGWTSNADISFENSSNKVTSWSATPSDTKYPSEKLVYDTFDDGKKTIAPNWSSSDVPNYKKGSIVYKGDVLYICKTNTPSSSWVASEWQETDLSKEILQPAPIDGFLYLQKNGIWAEFSSVISNSWVEINDKIGHIYQPSQNGRVSFLYNKHLALIMFLAWIDYGQDITSIKSTIFEFNNDLPGSQSNKLFTGTCPAITSSNGYGSGFGSVRILPNDDSEVDIARKVTYDRYQTNYRIITGINYVLSVNSSLLAAFNAYLE